MWKVVLSNDLFGDYNPYTELMNGDWLVPFPGITLHTGEVYLNDRALYEAQSIEEVKNPEMRLYGVTPPWSQQKERLLHPEDSIYQWYTYQEDGKTVIYANFQGKNPNEELTEINVRKCVFYPDKVGKNYITVRGFEMAQAACPWTPPTADQPGLLGVNWSKGWIIENNVIHDAKCSAISIGKEASTGDNLCNKYHRKPGYQYQMEAVFRARQIGWSKETIGSHVIRNNEIYDCGQNAVVGHMGCVFSEIHHNHIYNIAVRHEFFGYEIAGIKLHAAIDVQIHHNNIHNCTLGTWLDWQAQGTRVSKNLYYNNDRDLMVEVTHGPYIVDHNVFASAYNFDNLAQGGAYLHNLCCGFMRRHEVLDRSTPYHFAHTTQVAGTTLVYGGDDRFYQNIFVKDSEEKAPETMYGTAMYNGFLTSLQEFIDTVWETPGDVERFCQVKQPAYIDTNAYLNGAQAFDREEHPFVSTANPNVQIEVDEEKRTWLTIDLDDELFQMSTKIYETKDLEMPRIAEAPFENPDGTPIVWNSDFTDRKREAQTTVGPFEGLVPGRNRIRVW
jgi:hypothetical protein